MATEEPVPEDAGPLEDEDMWLYGEDAAAELQGTESSNQEQPAAEAGEGNDVVPASELVNGDEDGGGDQPERQPADDEGSKDNADDAEGDEAERDGDEEEEDEEDDSDEDDIQVTIGEIKANTTNTPVNINIQKRTFPQAGASNAAGNKLKPATLNMDSQGDYNGQSIYDVNPDSLEDKPWRKPGADITDYFNYGFTEETWRLYCDRQKKLRTEGGAMAGGSALITIGGGGGPMMMGGPPGPRPMMPPPPMNMNMGMNKGPDQGIATLNSIVNENSKYAGGGQLKKAGPPPGRKPSGTIDVIGGGGQGPSMLQSRRPPDTKENFITVLGSRPPLPPPGMPGPPPFGMPPFGMPPGMDFPPGMPPPGMPPMMNGQPMPFPGDFMPRFPPPPHMQGDQNFGEEEYHDGPPDMNNDMRDRDSRDRERADRDYGHRGDRGRGGYGGGGRDYGYNRDRGRSDYHHRDYDSSSADRSREHDREERRHRDRDREERKESDREHRSERDRGESSSRRRHHDDREDDHKSSSSSSRHKHAKRSKRDKDEEEESKK